MIWRLQRAHLPVLFFFVLLSIVLGTSHSLALLHLEGDSSPSPDSFLFQGLSGTLDFLFPFLMLILALALLPQDMKTGFLRYLVSRPCKRNDLFHHYAGLFCLVSSLVLLVYMMSLMLPYIIRSGQFRFPSPLWLLVILATPLFFSVIHFLLLFFYFLLGSGIASFASTVVCLFVMELAAGITHSYPLFPTSSLLAVAEWTFQRIAGDFSDSQTLLASLGGAITWNIALAWLNQSLFSNLNLNVSR